MTHNIIYREPVDLIIRRLVAFLTDAISILSIIIIIEFIICALVFLVIKINIPYYSSSSVATFIQSFLHWLLLILFLSFYRSMISGGTSIGCRITNTRVFSNRKPNLSLLASFLSYLLPLGLPYAYFVLVFVPYVDSTYSTYSTSPPLIEAMILFTTIVIWPISIIFTHGRQDIYDYILGGYFLRKKEKVHNRNYSIELIFALIVSVILSGILSFYILSSRDINRILSWIEQRVNVGSDNLSTFSSLIEDWEKSQFLNHKVQSLFVYKTYTDNTEKYKIRITLNRYDDENILSTVDLISDWFSSHISDKRIFLPELEINQTVSINVTVLSGTTTFEFEQQSYRFKQKAHDYSIGFNFIAWPSRRYSFK